MIFDRYDEKAQRIIFFARYEAGQLGSERITAAHLLLGIDHADEDLIEGLLPRGRWEELRETLASSLRKDSKVALSAELPMSEDAKKVLHRASSESLRLGHGGVSSGHLLLAILLVPSPASQALAARGLTSQQVTDRLGTVQPAPPGMKSCPVTLLGAGGVGCALLEQILDASDHHAMGYRLSFELMAIGDSSGLIMKKAGGHFLDRELRQLIEQKRSGTPLLKLSASQDWTISPHHAIPGSLLVDCTASSDVTPLLLQARRLGSPIVLANKKPLTGPQDDFARLVGESHPNRHCRWEATVGAGLPVIATVCRLLASGDDIENLQGTLSGTLGYLMSGLDAGRAFSELIREAHDKGYTEPDPREDLSGEDVARKALILARTAGWKMERKQIRVEGLVPPELDGIPLPEFWERLPELDDSMAHRVRKAGEKKARLRYTVRVEKQGCRVGLMEVPQQSPLGRLEGTNQLLEIQSRWYSPDPLVIQGRGAGVQATASGVLADMVELALVS